MKSISVFCGASIGNRPEYRAAAEEVGTLLAQQQIEIVYGAGNLGMMGAVANAALAAGGRVVGIIPKFLMNWEVAHHELHELIITENMHERKMKMFERIEGVMALAGGFGTMDEIFEMLTWSQLHLHNYPIGILNTCGYYDLLLAQLDKMEAEGFLRNETRKLLVSAETPQALIEKLLHFSNEPLKRDTSKI